MLSSGEINEMFKTAVHLLESGHPRRFVFGRMIADGATMLLNSHHRYGRELIHIGNWWGDTPPDKNHYVRIEGERLDRQYMRGWLSVAEATKREYIGLAEPLLGLVWFHQDMILGRAVREQSRGRAIVGDLDTSAYALDKYFERIMKKKKP